MTAVDTPEGDVVDELPVTRPERIIVTPDATEAPRRVRSLKNTAVATLVAVVSGLAVWFIVFALLFSGFEEHGSQARLYEKYRYQLAEATAPVGGAIAAGSPVALITAPSGGLHQLVVVEGTTARQLVDGPGHLRNTPLPGQAGTSEIFGRSVTFGRPFRDIAHMKAGDRITVTTGQGIFSYKVEDVRYPGDTLPVPLKAGQSRLTLVTSASGGWRSGWAPDRIVYVDALLVHSSVQPTVQPTPSGAPSTVSQASLPMHSDPGALIPLIFWLEALVVAGIAVVWSWVRWGRGQTWVVGVPVIFVILWGTSASLLQLLPNLL